MACMLRRFVVGYSVALIVVGDIEVAMKRDKSPTTVEEDSGTPTLDVCITIRDGSKGSLHSKRIASARRSSSHRRSSKSRA